ncbi:hypothetical protein ALC56_03628 [Trachymyrmex septentrionalis]|uniref:Uncharacterized protein n=1 Tax=Trachymyrmex septentrionalis TaxID=34720 RepID=A0A151JZS6_9HYME|nr:hypothetical protein ALC56_03628 [Trachymyrmex septentrionalis]
MDWMILNSNIRSDEEEEWTYIGARGQTVIDYAVVEGETRNRIESLAIGDKVESDQSIIVKIKEKKKELSKNTVRIGRKRRGIWNKKGREEFEKNLGEVEEEGRIDKEIEEIARKMKPGKRSRGTRREGKEGLMGRRM